MKCNIGWVERVVRVLLGLPMAVSYLYVRHFSKGWSEFLLIAGLWLMSTAALRWCPMSALVGFSTFSSRRDKPA